MAEWRVRNDQSSEREEGREEIVELATLHEMNDPSIKQEHRGAVT